MIFEYKDIPIYYKVSGTGTPLILLHGFLESAAIWESIVPLLSNHFRVIIIDLPGHGASGVLSETHTMEMHAQVVRDLLKFLNIEDPILVGHSMGGYVGLALIELYPNFLSGLLLLNSASQADSDERKKNRDRALKIMSTQKQTFVSMGITNLFSPASRQRFHAEIQNLKKTANQFPVQGILANIQGMRDREDQTETLRKFLKPKFILAGSKDPIIPLSQAKEDALNSNTKLIELSGSHMGWLENTDEIVKILHLIDKK